MNPLDTLPRVRKALYLAQFVVSGLLLLIGVGYGAAAADLPSWYGPSAAVASALWTYLGLTAATNTPSARRPGEHGQSMDYAVLVTLLALTALAALAFAVATAAPQ